MTSLVRMVPNSGAEMRSGWNDLTWWYYLSATAIQSKSLWSRWKLFLFSEGLKVLVFELKSKFGEASRQISVAIKSD